MKETAVAEPAREEREDRPAIRARVVRMERELAVLLDGWATPGSGSKGPKGDGQSARFLAEAKYSSQHRDGRPVIPFQCAWLETVGGQAERAGKIPLLALEWVDGRRLILIAAADYQALTGAPGPADLLLSTPLSHTLSTRVYPLSYPPVTPVQLDFPAVAVGATDWIGLTWSEFLDLRREVQPKRASKFAAGRKFSGGGLSRGGLASGKWGPRRGWRKK